MTINAKIIGVGGYLPEKILTNSDLEKMVDTDEEWIVSRTGIKTRHIANPEVENNSNLAYKAALQAIERSGIDKHEIELIIIGTSSPDYIFPSTACLVQAMLGLPGVPAYDMLAACSGFVYAMSAANAYIKSGQYKTVLVIGADIVSRFLDYKDRRTCILFGDGAGAVLLKATQEEGVIATNIKADGSYTDILACKGHINNNQIYGVPYIEMDGQAVFKLAVKSILSMVSDILSNTKYSLADVDLFIFHQANLRILEYIAQQLTIPMNKLVVTVDKQANTSAASIPLALNDAVETNKIKKGDLVLMLAMGGGFTWGASLIRY
jgi:3-oxoacyl-[acyl-carrier-protein] synthase-3